MIPPAPAPPPAPEPPAVPKLDASGPAEPVRLVAGGEPVSVPITIRNNGTAPSEPVTTTLLLPPGVTAQASAAGPAATTPQNASARSQPAHTRASGSIRCEPFEGGTRCTTAHGLEPGAAFTFDFRVHADESAEDNVLTAHVSAGRELGLRLPAVPVRIRPMDRIELDASSWGHLPWFHSRISLGVRNTGTTNGRAETVARIPDKVTAIGMPPECEKLPADPNRIRCATELRPGESFEGRVWLVPWPDASWAAQHGADIGKVRIPVTATLGSAHDSDIINVGLRPPVFAPEPPDDPPTSTTDESEPTSPSSPTTSSNPTPTSTSPPTQPSRPSEPTSSQSPTTTSSESPTSTTEPSSTEPSTESGTESSEQPTPTS